MFACLVHEVRRGMPTECMAHGQNWKSSDPIDQGWIWISDPREHPQFSITILLPIPVGCDWEIRASTPSHPNFKWGAERRIGVPRIQNRLFGVIMAVQPQPIGSSFEPIVYFSCPKSPRMKGGRHLLLVPEQLPSRLNSTPIHATVGAPTIVGGNSQQATALGDMTGIVHVCLKGFHISAHDYVAPDGLWFLISQPLTLPRSNPQNSQRSGTSNRRTLLHMSHMLNRQYNSAMSIFRQFEQPPQLPEPFYRALKIPSVSIGATLANFGRDAHPQCSGSLRHGLVSPAYLLLPVKAAESPQIRKIKHLLNVEHNDDFCGASPSCIAIASAATSQEIMTSAIILDLRDADCTPHAAARGEVATVGIRRLGLRITANKPTLSAGVSAIISANNTHIKAMAPSRHHSAPGGSETLDANLTNHGQPPGQMATHMSLGRQNAYGAPVTPVITHHACSGLKDVPAAGGPGNYARPQLERVAMKPAGGLVACTGTGNLRASSGSGDQLTIEGRTG
ncbi:hypothetical protein BD779DRAFT_1470487 [Infundibulicybe gibba]|nr:hypothetical protein BD779DRAFT_1470487 [Infundibulicybe gibba]